MKLVIGSLLLSTPHTNNMQISERKPECDSSSRKFSVYNLSSRVCTAIGTFPTAPEQAYKMWQRDRMDHRDV